MITERISMILIIFLIYDLYLYTSKITKKTTRLSLRLVLLFLFTLPVFLFESSLKFYFKYLVMQLKFGYFENLIKEYDYWVVLYRPRQVTIGSLVLICKENKFNLGRSFEKCIYRV